MKQNESKHVVVVLAAGEGRRYGGPKQLAEIHGEPMLRHILTNLYDPAEYRLLVVLGARASLIKPEITQPAIEIVENPDWKTGIASSIRRALAYVENYFPEANGLLVVLGDQWMLTKDAIAQMIVTANTNAGKIIAANYDGHPGVPVYFPKTSWSILSTLSGDEGAKQALKSEPDVVLIDIPEARVDLDYQDDQY